VVEEKSQVVRLVLDTNVLVSALLFGHALDILVAKWKTGAIVPIFSRATFDELRRVLRYPRFALSEAEIRTLIEDEMLPYFEVVQVEEEIQGVCRDPWDDMFLSCALAARADSIVTGDKDLLDLSSFRDIPIIHVRDLLQQWKGE
jgi:uncharacterized protein